MKTTKTVAPVEIFDAPTPLAKIPLKTIDDVRAELARVYREMRRGLLEPQQGTRLAYVLQVIVKAIEVHDIDRRLDQMEQGLERAITNVRTGP